MCQTTQLGDAMINDYKLCSYKFCFCSRSFFQYSWIQWFRNEIWINFFSIKICIDSWIIKVAMLKSYFLFKVKSLLLNLIWNFDDNKRFINDHRFITSENSEIPHFKFHMPWNIKNLPYQKWTLSKMDHTKNGLTEMDCIWYGPYQKHFYAPSIRQSSTTPGIGITSYIVKMCTAKFKYCTPIK